MLQEKLGTVVFSWEVIAKLELGGSFTKTRRRDGRWKNLCALPHVTLKRQNGKSWQCDDLKMLVWIFWGEVLGPDLNRVFSDSESGSAPEQLCTS